VADAQLHVGSSASVTTYVNLTPSVQANISGLFYRTTLNAGQDSVVVTYGALSDDDRQNQFIWDFGGTHVTQNTLLDFSYPFPTGNVFGAVSISLTVEDFYHAKSTYFFPLWINKPPTASFTLSRVTANAGMPVTIDASSTTDDIQVSFNINFKDGQSSGATITSHVYSVGGVTYAIELVATDNYGATNSYMREIYVAQRPTADIRHIAMQSGKLTANIGEPIQLIATASSFDSHVGGLASLEWLVVESGLTKNTSTCTVSFQASGYHVVVLRITDNWGAVAVATHSIYVNAIPTASFSFASGTIYVPYTLTLDATGTLDDDHIVTYDWDFGDGTILATSGAVISHRYTQPDTINILLKVTDGFGATNSMTLSLKLYSTIRWQDRYFASIQQAVNSASAGSVVFINTAFYQSSNYSENLILTKSMTLENETPTAGKIKLNGAGNTAITISGNGISITLSHMEIFGGRGVYGGAINVDGGYVYLHNVIISGSSADYGAGMYAQNCNLDMRTVTIAANTATQQGGGLFLSACTATITYGYIQANQATLAEGGALFAQRSSIILFNNLVARNQSNRDGGAFYVRNCRWDERQDTVAMNTANIGISGIYGWDLSTINIQNTVYYHLANEMFFDESISRVTLNHCVIQSLLSTPAGKTSTFN
ncbi:MAG: PKD domain-containing protein, partial [Candidatus Margulisiibacteriota bacterium]